MFQCYLTKTYILSVDLVHHIVCVLVDVQCADVNVIHDDY